MESTHQNVSPDSIRSISDSLNGLNTTPTPTVDLVVGSTIESNSESCIESNLVKEEQVGEIEKEEKEGKPGHNPYLPDPIFYDNLCKEDVYLMLRFLSCMAISIDGNLSRIHSDQLGDSHVDQLSPSAIKCRLLALELLLGIFTNAGPVLSSLNDSLLFIIKHYICIVISRNAMVTDVSLFECSISLFLLILKSYLPGLKSEVQILLNSVFLHILEMESSTFRQKSMVLQGLSKLCQNSKVIFYFFFAKSLNNLKYRF